MLFRSRETADHSIPYVVAATLMDGTVTPRSFNDQHLWNPELRALIHKIEVVPNAEFSKAYVKLPVEHREKARKIGIGLALIMRLGLLGTVAWIVQLTTPVFELFGHGYSWKDMILIAGGLFLVWKATKEIHHAVDPEPAPDVFDGKTVNLGFGAAIGQIIMLDLVFSLDSIITAVGMTDHLPIMVISVLVAVGVMLLAADPLARFIAANPTIVMLALGFLLIIGTTLIAEGCGAHVPKGYIYTAMEIGRAHV